MPELSPHGRLKHIPPDSIEKNPENPRLFFRQEEMEQLLSSIDEIGIQVPLAVYEAGGRYHLIDGERRWRCALKLNLKTVPALVQERPSTLQNLLLMYNIHALREQWDYFTIASKLHRISELFEEERRHVPTEQELSASTGLTRGQIRRCRFLIDLPERYKGLLVEELRLPKTQQQLNEDFFIEMERALKTVVKRIPEYKTRLNKVRDALVKKYRQGTISAVTDFRQLSKIATAVENLGLTLSKARRALDKVFDPDDEAGIREAYAATVAFSYDEQEALRYISALNSFIEGVLEGERRGKLDDDVIKELDRLYRLLRTLLRG